MGARTNAAPIIIKKKRGGGGGDSHHGGAWKVAYADFVTAMMAFFMLMWLLNATTEKQRKGLADYFSPTIPVNPVSGGGDGAFGGDSMFSEKTLVMDGSGATRRNPADAKRARGSSGVAQEGADLQKTEDFTTLEARLLGKSGESLLSKKQLEHIVTKVTDEGLVVELFATEGTPLFKTDSDQPTRLMQDLVRAVARSSDVVTNGIAIGGHTRTYPVILVKNPVWGLSSARAGQTREMLERFGVAPARIQRVTGHGERKPADYNPMAARNNRIEIIFLRDS